MEATSYEVTAINTETGTISMEQSKYYPIAEAFGLCVSGLPRPPGYSFIQTDARRSVSMDTMELFLWGYHRKYGNVFVTTHLDELVCRRTSSTPDALAGIITYEARRMLDYLADYTPEKKNPETLLPRGKERSNELGEISL